MISTLELTNFLLKSLSRPLSEQSIALVRTGGLRIILFVQRLGVDFR